MSVKRWVTPNDANHDNHHVMTGGVEFFRFPYSPYMARVGQFTAIVSRYTIGGQFHATVYRPDPKSIGATIPVANYGNRDQDQVFVWTAAQLKELEGGGYNGRIQQST